MSDELTPKQLSELGVVLTTLKSELESHIADAEHGTKPVDLDEPIGRLSRMDAMQQQQMAAATKRGFVRRLNFVTAAIGRFERGVFGECLGCEEPIAFRRLRARPESTRCTTCQDRADKA